MEDSKKFVLVDINDSKSKQLALNLSNDTSRKILDYLGGINEASETSIAEKLNLSLSTVHYNLQHLRQAGLVEVKQFSWSKKGKKIEYYKIAEKLIIIAPKSSEKASLLKSLSQILPIAVISLGGAGLIYTWTRPINKMDFASTKNVAETSLASSVASAASPTPFFQSPLFLFGIALIVIIIATIIILRKYPKASIDGRKTAGFVEISQSSRRKKK